MLLETFGAIVSLPGESKWLPSGFANLARLLMFATHPVPQQVSDDRTVVALSRFVLYD